jgi:fatty-acyl-CoA synthase
MSSSQLQNPNQVTTRFATLGEALESAARSGTTLWLAQGDKEPERLTYQDLLDRSRAAAAHFVSMGLQHGDRVIVMLPTGEAWLVAFFGTLLAGGVAVPVGPTFSFGGLDRYAQTIRHIAIDAGARLFVGGPVVEPYLPLLREGNPALEQFVKPERLAEPPPACPPLRAAASGDLAVLQYTSGTTGLPKGVMLSHRALLANAYMIGSSIGMHPADVGVSWLPLFHDMGLVGALMTSLYWHYALLLMPPETFLMHPRRWLQAISRLRATLTVAPNFAYQMALDRVGDRHAKDLDLSSLRCAFNGSEAVRPATVRAFVTRFADKGFREQAMRPVYGMAENTLAATFPPPTECWQSEHLDREALERRRQAIGAPEGSPAAVEMVSVGTPLAGVSVEIRDAADRCVPVGEVGEVVIKSPSLMDGYWRDPERTAQALRDGWLRTGDLGFVRDGRLYLTGRAKELIIKRGSNYSPDDFEQIASEAGGGHVLKAAAFSCANERVGTEDIVLLLETRTLPAEVREQIEKDIGGALIAALGVRADVTLFVAPRSIPRTTSGKVQRAALRARYLRGEIGAESE